MSDKPAEGAPEITADVESPTVSASSEQGAQTPAVEVDGEGSERVHAPEATVAARPDVADTATSPDAASAGSTSEERSGDATNDRDAPGPDTERSQGDTQQDARKPEGQNDRATQDAGADGQTGQTGNDAKTGGKAADPDLADRDREQTFKIYADALEGADWAYKSKAGDDREIGYKTVMIAEKAYISAGLYDKAEADRLWEEATHRPPKLELQQRLAESQGVDPAAGIADLSASLATMKQRQLVNNISLSREAADKQISSWESALGDHQARQREFRHKAADELLKPEAPDRNDEGGLGMFLRAIKGGYRAGKDITMAAAHGKRFNEVSENKSNAEEKYASLGEELKKAQGVLAGDSSKYVAEQGEGLEPTVGDVGKNARRFPAVRQIVDKVMGNKVAPSLSKEPLQQAVEAALTPEKADAIDPARRSFIMAGMGDKGRGIGG